MSSTPSHSNNTEKRNDLSDFQGVQVNESKLWRKFKQDPVVPIGKIFFLFDFYRTH